MKLLLVAILAAKYPLLGTYLGEYTARKRLILKVNDNGSCRYFEGGDSPVCVCDVASCPPLHPASLTPPSAGHVVTYTSSRGGLRFQEQVVAVHGPESEGGLNDSSMNRAVVEVACLSPRQVMNGFGGSFTDSATITMNSLSPPVLDALLRSYFSPEGLEYELVRVPIGGSDFSVRPYTYDDDHEGDVELNHFQLAGEDLVYKLPFIHRALDLAQRPLKVMASPWSAPGWMKTNGKINETGQLLTEMRRPWADYLVRFVKEYEKAGVPIWGLTSQNHGFTHEKTSWNSMSWNPSDMRDWIKDSLGPALHAAGLERVKLYIGDDVRDNVDNSYRQVCVCVCVCVCILQDPEAARYVTGLAFHWYHDQSVSPDVLDHAHLLFPDKDLLYTEACIESGGVASHQPVVLGSWTRAERYAQNIIEDVNHFASGWIDWNLALDPAGGPNWAGNEVDAPIIINPVNICRHIFANKLMTFSCLLESGGVASHQPVVLGSWTRAERYAQNIIEDVNHFASGWIDWNLALDPAGGPNWAGNEVDAPIIINPEKDEFYKQPIFYVMGHFSKFVPAGSVSIPSWVRGNTAGLFHTAAFVHPDGYVVLQLLNKNDTETEVRVEWEGGDFTLSLVPPRSFQTLLLPWEGDTTHAKRKYSLQSHLLNKYLTE
ncbi:lysosomal acid glucosylceramidase-like [Scylla paramamosain]|uniref:lysosomal acid glucosylceramidase-like n=1 Tax=Scylla paramamosain TaxID=85552 RepID=UPI003082E4B2